MNRRRLLAVGASMAALLAGCSGDASETPSTSTRTDSPGPSTARTPRPAPHLGSFVLWNDDDERHRVTLTVSDDDAVLVDETRELAPGLTADVENPLETQGVYSVVARVDGEQKAARTWRVERCTSIEYLQLYVGDGGRADIRTMRQTIDPHPTCA